MVKRAPFEAPIAPEEQYARALRNVAKQVNLILDAAVAKAQIGDVKQALEEVERALEAYAVAISPWSVQVANMMLNAVDRHNSRVWAARISTRTNSAYETRLPNGESSRLSSNKLRPRRVGNAGAGNGKRNAGNP